MQILVVDDSKAMRMIVRRTLRMADRTVWNEGGVIVLPRRPGHEIAYLLTKRDTAIPKPMSITMRRTVARPSLRATPAPP